jgi:hypothetical protein
MSLKYFLIMTVIVPLLGCDSLDRVIDKSLPAHSNTSQKLDAYTIEIDQKKPVIVAPGQVLTLRGNNFDHTMQLQIAGVQQDFKLKSRTEIEVALPATLKTGKVNMVLKRNANQTAIPRLFALVEGDYPLITSDPATICNDVVFYNAEGEVKTGARDCQPQPEGATTENLDKAFASAELKPENIRIGVYIGGVMGSLAPAPEPCSGALQSDCVATTRFKTMDTELAGKAVGLTTTNFAARLASPDPSEFWDASGVRHTISGSTELNADNIKVGVQLWGVAGSFTGGSYTACASDGAVACVANASYPAAAISELSAKVLSGYTVAGVAGAAIVEAHGPCTGAGQMGCVATSTYKTMDLSAASAMTDLTGGNFNTVIAAVDSFEFWDSAGKRYQLAGDTDLIAAYIKGGKTIFGVTGTAVIESHSPCAADGAVSCVANASYTAAATSGLAAKVVSGNTVAGVAGATIAESHTNCLADGATGCVATGSYAAADTAGLALKVVTGSTVAGVAGAATAESHSSCLSDGAIGCIATSSYTAAATSGLAAKVLSGNTVAGVVGTAVAESHADCLADGATGCVAAGSYVAANTVGLAPKVLTGYTVAGVAGSAPPAPANCGSNGSQNCVAAGSYIAATACAADSSNCYVPGYALTTQPLKAISYDAINVGKGSMRTTLTLSGVTGTLMDCSNNNVAGCVTTESFKSADWTNLTAANIKKDVLVAGIMGDYPSATNLLTGASGTADLDNASFNIKIKSATPFEWFGPDGTRYQGEGDADITAANIVNPISIFGTTGEFVGGGSNCTGDGQIGCITTSTYKSIDTSALASWDIRHGKTAGGIAGQLLFLKDSVSLASFDRAPLGTIDFYDTIDDYNVNGTVYPTTTVAGWYSPANTDVWQRDAASDTGVGGGVASNGACDGTEECIYIDRLTGLSWARANSTPRTWSNAINDCDSKIYGGRQDWRLPTARELMQAYIDGIYRFRTTSQLNSNMYVWSATSRSDANVFAWRFDLSSGIGLDIDKDSTTAGTSMCVAP